MHGSERTFEIEYRDWSLSADGTYDVTFDLTEDAEEILFRSMAQEITDEMEDGRFPEQQVHLFYRLLEQRRSHPPWMDTGPRVRTYDLVISSWDYHILSMLIGDSLSSVLDPKAATNGYETLVEVWQDVTDQIIEQRMETSTDDEGSHPNPNVECVRRETLMDGSTFDVYRNERTGDEWYTCLDCETTYSEIGTEHECRNSNE